MPVSQIYGICRAQNQLISAPRAIWQINRHTFQCQHPEMETDSCQSGKPRDVKMQECSTLRLWNSRRIPRVQGWGPVARCTYASNYLTIELGAVNRRQHDNCTAHLRECMSTIRGNKQQARRLTTWHPKAVQPQGTLREITRANWGTMIQLKSNCKPIRCGMWNQTLSFTYHIFRQINSDFFECSPAIAIWCARFFNSYTGIPRSMQLAAEENDWQSATFSLFSPNFHISVFICKTCFCALKFVFSKIDRKVLQPEHN